MLMKAQKRLKETDRSLIARCYTAGMKNEWASGRADLYLGNPIVEEDRLNPHSISIYQTRAELKEIFRHGNWCLGMGIIYADLFLLQQVNGGDEWGTFKITDKEIFQFESVSFQRILKESEVVFDAIMDDLINATPEQCRTLTYMTQRPEYDERWG